MLSAQSMGSVCIGAVMTKIGHRLKMLHFTSVSVDVFQEEKCVVLLSDDDAVSFAVFFGRNKGLFILVLIIKRMLVPSLNRTSPGYRLYYTQSFNHKVMVWRSSGAKSIQMAARGNFASQCVILLQYFIWRNDSDNDLVSRYSLGYTLVSEHYGHCDLQTKPDLNRK